MAAIAAPPDNMKVQIEFGGRFARNYGCIYKIIHRIRAGRYTGMRRNYPPAPTTGPGYTSFAVVGIDLRIVLSQAV